MTILATGRVQIRRAARDDLEAMLRIERASFADPWSEESFTTALSLERMHVLVAEEAAPRGDGAAGLVGYVVALVVGPEAEIADLAVDPVARRRGIGRALLDRVIAALSAAGVAACYLEVRESNDAARTLYETVGFRAVGRRRGYYRHPVEDALLLKREIAPM